MQLWPVAHFFSFCHHFWVGATAKQQQTHPKVMTEWKKWATGQSCIRKEVTSYKIHTLVMSMMTCSHLHLLNVCTLLTLNQFVYILRVIIVLVQTILRLCTRCLLRFEYQLPHPILSTTLSIGKRTLNSSPHLLPNHELCYSEINWQ